VFDTRVGAAVEVSGSLFTRAIVTSTPPVFGARGEVDAESTAVAHLDCLTPGCSYTTDSGFSYTTSPAAVPEPGILALLGMGIAGVWTLGWRSHPA
jgi:PEP-CTERM motif-containing protein